MTRLFLSLFSIIFILGLATAQKQTEVIQFSGSVVTIEDEEIVPVQLTNILIEKSGRGTFADLDGFFSIVAEESDVIVFSAIGYETVRFVIPDTLTTNRYTIIQLLSRDTINLPMAQIFPGQVGSILKSSFWL
ncbi:MAG: carboxypeptidase-like regulatory domain-containing protein [Saprospiraceae bacterium]|nr:carboxypeptidase-like regulatory domain-containing protein [Saprospiraceae bacterium]